jgi:HEAT repeat protein
MKNLAVLLLMMTAAFAASDNTARFLDKSLPASLRNDACFALRGDRSEAAIEAAGAALRDPKTRRCAEDNLRLAGAVDVFTAALEEEDNPELRAVAARALGTFQKPELAARIARAGKDSHLLVATNAIEGLSYYTDRAIVVPYLVDLTKRTGIVGSLAFEQLIRLGAREALSPARELVHSNDPADLLPAMRVLGSMGERSDIPALEGVIQRFPDTATTKLPTRGFGLMPAISLSRAANASIAQIRAR